MKDIWNIADKLKIIKYYKSINNNMFGEKENTDEKIIKATFKIVHSEGIQKATTKKIAAEAGVNEVTIFRKFENKKNLIEVTKDYYINILIEKLENNFSFSEDEDIGVYLRRSYDGFLDFTNEDFSIIKIALQEIRDVPGRKLLITQITDIILGKLEEYFVLQSQKGTIKDINPKAVAALCFSIMFQSIILWQLYNNNDITPDYYADDFLDILFNGMTP